MNTTVMAAQGLVKFKDKEKKVKKSAFEIPSLQTISRFEYPKKNFLFSSLKFKGIKNLNDKLLYELWS